MLSRQKDRDQSHRHYKSKGSVCRKCPQFGICTKSKSSRVVVVSIHEDLIKANRKRMHSEAARPLMIIWRQRGESPFGFFKQFGGLSRFAGRGLEYASKKPLIASAGWNLLLVIKKIMREMSANPLTRKLLEPILALFSLVLKLLDPRSVRRTITARANC